MTQIDGEIYHVHGSEDQYSENEYTTQSNLQIQCNPYQATNGIFHRNEQKDNEEDPLQACILCEP